MRVRTFSQLVAIVGGSGAGKTWLTTQLHRVLGDRAAHLSLDEFYRDRSHLSPAQRARVNYDHPRAIDWPWLERALADCRAGRPTRIPQYDFSTHTRKSPGRHQEPKPIILVDGLWLLRRPAHRRQFDLRIFLECPERIRLRRRVRRDVGQRGREDRAVRRQFRSTVGPLHRRFVASQVRWANLVLKQPLTESGATQLGDRLWDLVQRHSLYPVWGRETFKAELRSRLRRPKPSL